MQDSLVDLWRGWSVLPLDPADKLNRLLEPAVLHDSNIVTPVQEICVYHVIELTKDAHRVYTIRLNKMEMLQPIMFTQS